MIEAEVRVMQQQAKGCRQLRKAGKAKETTSFLDLPEGKQPCQHLGFSLIRPLSDF